MTITQEITHHKLMNQIGQNAKAAAQNIATASTKQKNMALLATRDFLLSHTDEILAANAKDMEAAEKSGLDSALVDRLMLDKARIDGIATGLAQIAELPDPVGEVTDSKQRPSGIQVGKMRVPIGVIGIIYESRPNVTIDAGALCLKSGNACVLRGGKEALHSNQVLARALSHGLESADIDPNCVQVIDIIDREMVTEMVQAEKYIDAIIPRGSKNLIKAISEQAKVPVIKHLDGVCHVYIDESADLDIASDIAINAKTRRYGVCGSMETLLINEQVAGQVLPALANRYKEIGVELRGCERVHKIIEANDASEDDWFTEYLGPILSIKIVDSVDDAIAHINHYGSHHTDSIVSTNYNRIQQFLRAVDSSSVMVNTSTQFADGFEYGLGAEIGISTNKLHVRGPVGLEGLTIQKYIVQSDGVIRP